MPSIVEIDEVCIAYNFNWLLFGLHSCVLIPEYRSICFLQITWDCVVVIKCFQIVGGSSATSHLHHNTARSLHHSLWIFLKVSQLIPFQ